ncbi:probable F-box At4g22030 [Olea europaea subsp. europaea]|uniref:Probable F-box At4g22030 n=1 Tax=Olea europaea subsp. europaea TaxID=158383 RepID=A0A8S0S1F4_OLEEU|nr:probable F-box At4g22030 [Olea europaea subsp. europaea]
MGSQRRNHSGNLKRSEENEKHFSSGLRSKGIVEELESHNFTDRKLSPININTFKRNDNDRPEPLVIAKLYAILEAVADRVEMHKNIGEQRNNWNSLLLTSINALTLAAAAMTGIAATSAVGGGAPVAALKLSSTVMYLSATGMLSLMNKIQPSQLAEEQRNAARGIIRATLNVPRRMTNISPPRLQSKGIVEEPELHNFTDTNLSPINVNTFKRNDKDNPEPFGNR